MEKTAVDKVGTGIGPRAEKGVAGRSSTLEYRADIDGIRGIAVLAVVIFHAFPEFLPGGFVGVDVFFVISGFLITGIILENLQQERYSFIEFYSRRIRRIFPSLLTTLLASYAFGWLALLSTEYEQLGKHIAAGAGFVSNLVLQWESGYFDVAAEMKPLLHLWSLGVEEQYYILWPLILWLAWRRRLGLQNLILYAFAASFLLNIFNAKVDAGTFFSPFARFWELMAGSILAYAATHRKKSETKRINWINSDLRGKLEAGLSVSINPDRFGNILSVTGMILLLISLIVISRQDAYPGWWAILPVASATLLITAGQRAWLNKRVLSHPSLVWVGLISFPLYLWHWPLLSYARIIESETPSVEYRIVALAVSVALSWLTYELIEKKLRYGGNLRAKTVLLSTLMLVMGTVGFATYEMGGLSFRHKTVEAQLEQFGWKGKYVGTAQCRRKYHTDAYFCISTNPGAPPTAAIIGDSHENHFYPGLGEYFRKHGGNLINLGAGGCPPFFDMDTQSLIREQHCLKSTKPVYDFVLQSGHIKTVFLGFHHGNYFGNNVKLIDTRGEIRSKDNFRNAVEVLVRTIKALQSHGKKVVIIYDLPDLKRDIKDCFPLRPLTFNTVHCKLDRSIFLQDFDQYQKLLDELQRRTSVTIFDTRPYWDQALPVDKNGVAAYRDPTHLSVNGSMFFADKYRF